MYICIYIFLCIPIYTYIYMCIYIYISISEPAQSPSCCVQSPAPSASYRTFRRCSFGGLGCCSCRVCVCVSVSGVLFSVGVCVCDLLICLPHRPCFLACTRYCFNSRLLSTNQSSVHCPLPPALPAVLQYYCTSIARYTTLPTEPPFSCHTLCNIGHGNIV